MIKLREVINFKAAVVGAVFLTTLSGFVSESAEAARIGVGGFESLHTTHTDSGTGHVWIDPLPGTIFEGQTVVRYNRKRVFPINEFGWFGSFSNDPQATFPDTGDGIFADANASFDLLPPNENLNVSVCNVQFGDPIGCNFNPFVSLPLPKEEFYTVSFSPQDFPEDDFFAVNFDFGEEGLTVDTQESFNFFGFFYQFNPQAFKDTVVGISLVEPGTGDLGLVPLEDFNIINCIPQGSPEGNFATDRCGETEAPLDIAYVTDAIVLDDFNNPGFSYNFDIQEGTLSNGDPFQLFDDSFLTPSRVNEPHNNLGLLALGVFGANLGLKRRRKQQKSSEKHKL